MELDNIFLYHIENFSVKLIKKQIKMSLSKESEQGFVNIVLDQFKDVTILGLLISVIVGFILSSFETNPDVKISYFIEPFIIFILLVINALISIVFELQQQRALKSSRLIKSENKIILIKNGKEIEITSDELKIGDVIMLCKGDRAPTDIQIQQILTKTIQYEIIDKSNNLSLSNEKEGIIISGASITQGALYGSVICLPKSSISHRISIRKKPSGKSFLSQIDSFSHIASLIFSIGCFAIFPLSLTKMKDHENFVKGALSLARIPLALIVASLPEHLSIIFKNAQKVAAKKMLKRDAIINETSAIDTIGRITVLCGNLSSAFTSNVGTVQEFTTISDDIVDVFTVTGNGYSPKGEIQQCGKAVDTNEHKTFEKIAAASMLSARLKISEHKTPEGSVLFAEESDFISASLQAFAVKLVPYILPETKKAPNDLEKIKSVWNEIDKQYPREILQEFSRKEKCAIYNCGSTKYTLGQFNTVFKKCKNYLDDTSGEIVPISQRVRDKLEYKLYDWSKNYRILGLSYEDPNNSNNNIWLAGIAVYNPLHEDAMSSIEDLHGNGIRVIIVSGESLKTVSGYAKKMRLFKKSENESKDNREDNIISEDVTSITRQQWLQMTDEQKQESAKHVDLYIEFTEDEKLQLVKILHEQGEIVGMISGSVPDFMALRESDIGIATVGSSQCTRGSSSLLLNNDSDIALSSAVILSRSAVRTSVGCVRFLLSCGISMLLVCLFTALLNTPTLLTSSSILLIALLTQPFTAFISTNVNMHYSMVLREKDRAIFNKSIIPFRVKVRFILIGVIGALCAISAALFVFLVDTTSLKHPIVFSDIINYTKVPRSARTLLEDPAAPTITALVILIIHIINAYEALCVNGFSLKKNLAAALSLVLSLVLFLAFTEIPFLRSVSGLCHLSVKRWIVAIVCCLPVYLVNFVIRIVFREK